MTEKISKLEKNPRAYLEQYILTLQSESKVARKRALVKIHEEIFENSTNSDCDLTVVFPEIYAYILKGFSDASESCRETSILIITNFIERLPLNDYYLTYILPVIVRRIGCPEIVEESEEIRLVLIELVHKILQKYKGTHYLTPFLNDFTSILTKTSTDPFPKVKLEACECMIVLTKTMQREFHFQSESYVKPVLSNFAHQHFRVRVAAVRAIGAIVLTGNTKCFELSITPMAEKLFDENTQVRLQVTMEVGNWMLSYRDRYSFWHKMIPLLLTSLSDVMADVRVAATNLWNDIGLQYMEENEEDLKKKTDFLKDVPTHYPDVKRPNLGCRVLVQSNIGKIVPAIGREMDGWQADARLRSSQLLCWLLLCAEEGSTQHANAVVRILHRGASDDDERVVQEIKRASELFGYFITPDVWWPLVEGELDSWGALLALGGVLRGSRPQLLAEVLPRLCDELARPDRCRTRKPKYQRNLLRVCEAVMDVCGAACAPVAAPLFVVNFTVLAMPHDDGVQIMALSNLDKLRQVEQRGASRTGLYERHLARVLAGLVSDPATWNLLSPERCLLECVLVHSGSALGSQLHLIAPLLNDTLAPTNVDPEVKLKIFTALSRVLLQKQIHFSECDPDKLEAFLKIVVEEVILPNLVWSPGRTAEALRSAATACLCAALQRPDTPVAGHAPSHTHAVGDPPPHAHAAGDAPQKEVDLFPSGEGLEVFLERAVPLVVALADDGSALTRMHALRAVESLAGLAHHRGCFSTDMLHKMYFAVLKRLDDSSDVVRAQAARALCGLFTRRPRPYDARLFGAHVDALYAALLVHLDDADETFRALVLDTLLELSDIDPILLMKKIKANIHLYRNKAAYEKLSTHIENIAK